MTVSGISAAGFSAPRGADYLASIKAEINTRLTALGLVPLSDDDWDRDAGFGVIAAVVAARLGSLAQAVQGLYDSRTLSNATGSNLDSLCVLVGVTRNAATKSAATVTFTGTAGVVIPAGTTLQGGGPSDLAQWATTADLTIGAGGTVDGVVQCTVAGATTAAIGAIDLIVNPVAGLVSGTNAAAATVGRDLESDAALRKRRAQALAARGSGSTASIRSALLALDYVTGVAVVENGTGSTVTTRGVKVDPHGVAVVVAPNTITAAQKQAIGELLYSKVSGGIKTSGSDVTATVTGGDGIAKTILYDLADSLAVTVACTVTLDDGYVLGDVSMPINTVVSDYIATLNVGDRVPLLDIYAAIATVDGVRDVTALTLNGGTATITPDLDEIPTLSGSVSVST